MMSILVAVHALAAIVWVGGMFFAYLVLRPSAGPLEPAQRLALWRRVFDRFFPWVWAAVLLLLGTGFAMLFAVFGGFAQVGMHVHVMLTAGIVMMALFGHLYFAPWRRMQRALDDGAAAAAARSLDQIRLIVAVNLALGLLTAAVGAGGRYL